MEIIILGIDPGSCCTGYGLIKYTNKQCAHLSNGNIRVSSRYSMSDRLYHVYENILELIKTHNPQHIAIEKVFMGKNAIAALKLGQARSCALIAAASLNIPVYEYSPREIKQAVTGYGGAIKSQVQQMVTTLLKLSQTPAQDAADALAIALCHASIYTFNQKIKEGS